MKKDTYFFQHHPTISKIRHSVTKGSSNILIHTHKEPQWKEKKNRIDMFKGKRKERARTCVISSQNRWWNHPHY